MQHYDKPLARLAGMLILLALTAVAPAAEPPAPAAHQPQTEAWHSSTQMAAAARALIETLDAGQRKAVLFPLDDSKRTNWSNLPVVMVEPPGLFVGAMSDAQKAATHALLRASLSSQGYAKFTSIMRLEDLLHEIDAARLAAETDEEGKRFRQVMVDSRSYGNYAVAIFGEPGADSWGWKLAGHHAAANFTVSKGRVGFTPTFLGSSPMAVESGPYAGLMALPQEGSRGIELMQALTDEQRQQAIIHPEVASDVVEGAGRRASLSRYEGLKADGLSAEQLQLLQVLVAEYVRNADFDAAEAQLATIGQAGWGELYFSWRGPVDAAGRFYYRVHGPRILIEYNRQDTNHDHTVVRDPRNDYGEDWLGQHLEEHHPSMEEAMENARKRAEELK